MNDRRSPFRRARRWADLMHNRGHGSRLASAFLVALLATGALAASPTSAITNGTSDNGNHPWVGLLTLHDATNHELGRCTATLLSPWVMITAGHCTYGFAKAVVYFDQGPIIPDPAFSFDTRSCDGIAGYPCGGGVTGTPVPNPSFTWDHFATNDVGLVLLDTPVYAAAYAQLPQVGSLSALTPGPRSWFTTIGYGYQKSFPDPAAWKDVAIRERMVAYPQLKEIDGPRTGSFSMWLTVNAVSGGACFGDSGGPNFIGSSNVIAGVTSYGITYTCQGPNGVYRLDSAADLEWIMSYLE